MSDLTKQELDALAVEYFHGMKFTPNYRQVTWDILTDEEQDRLLKEYDKTVVQKEADWNKKVYDATRNAVPQAAPDSSFKDVKALLASADKLSSSVAAISEHREVRQLGKVMQADIKALAKIATEHREHLRKLMIEREHIEARLTRIETRLDDQRTQSPPGMMGLHQGLQELIGRVSELEVAVGVTPRFLRGHVYESNE